MAPNIRPKVKPHSECWRQSPGQRALLGDVRYCIHGKVQVLVDVPVGHRTQGPGMWYWQDISRFWSPRLYRRAKEALDT